MKWTSRHKKKQFGCQSFFPSALEVAITPSKQQQLLPMTPPRDLPPPTKPLSRVREKQIMPGVYFTPPPTTDNLHSSIPIQRNVLEMSLQELRHERDELAKTLQMLVSSNEAMKEMNPNNDDPDLVEAVGENCEIIVRRRRRLHDLQTRIAEVAPAPCDGDRIIAGGERPSETGEERGMFL